MNAIPGTNNLCFLHLFVLFNRNFHGIVLYLNFCMLKNSLYIIKTISSANTTIKAEVELNAQHKTFEGHFPGQPVLPGACMLQMVKEILQTFLNVQLQLIKADEIKFLSVIQPTGENLHFSIEYDFTESGVLKIAAKIIVNEVVCFKMRSLFSQKEK